jgi:hypothetical protein
MIEDKIVQGVIYYCPACQSVLSCQADPLLLAEHTAELVKAKG